MFKLLIKLTQIRRQSPKPKVLQVRFMATPKKKNSHVKTKYSILKIRLRNFLKNAQATCNCTPTGRTFWKETATACTCVVLWTKNKKNTYF